MLSIISYALLLLLHEHDNGASSSTGDGSTGKEESERGEPIWRKDPLASLPQPVVDETVHVAGMIRGLMDMEECEKFNGGRHVLAGGRGGVCTFCNKKF